MTLQKLAEKIFGDRRLALLLLVCLSLGVYLNSLNGAFVSDDVQTIVKNPLIADSGKYLKMAHIAQFSLSLNYHLGQFHPFVYHLSNLLLHLGVVLLGYLFIKGLVGEKVAVASSALYAVHPLNTEVVSWISGRPYGLGALFALASLVLYLFAFKKDKYFSFYYSASIIFFLFGLLSNSKLIIFVLILGLYEMVFGKLAKNWLKLIPYGLITLAFIIYLVQPFQTRVVTENPEYTGGVELMNPVIQIPVAISGYLERFVFPYNLSFYHEDLSVPLFNYLVMLTITVTLLGSLIYFYLKEKVAFFGLAFFLVSLIPTLLPIRIAWVVAERYVYFGLLGLCLIVGWYLVKFLEKYDQVLLIVLGILVVLLSMRTMARNRDWQSIETLYIATAKASPTSSKAWNNMGDLYSSKKDYRSSILAFQRAIQLRPDYVDAHHNVGVTYLQMQDFDNAILWFEKAIAIYPLAQSYNDMGVAYFYKGMPEKAEECFQKGLAVDPGSSLIHNSLGLIYLKTNRLEEARQAWLKALELDPYNQGVMKNLQLLEQNLQASPSASPKP